MTLAAFASLARTSTSEQIKHMEDAAAANNLALVEAVCLEFSGGENVAEFRERYARGLRQDPRAAGAPLRSWPWKSRVPGWPGQGRFTAATTGRSDPLARITVARTESA